MSRMGQSGSLIWMFSGMTPSALGWILSGGQIDGDAVEAAIHIFPAVGVAVAFGDASASGSRRG